MFKVVNNIAATIIDDLFTRSYNSYYLRLKCNFVVPVVRTVCNDQNSIQDNSPFIWNMVPYYIKDALSVVHVVF